MARLQPEPVSADNFRMSCSHCGRDAVVKRGQAYFCDQCAVADDWRAVIRSLQDASTAPAPVANTA